MAELKKVEIQLLDPATGAFIEAVNPVTSASAVTFTDGKTFQEKLNDGSLRGQQGAQGPKGDVGVQGSQGLKGDTGAKGDKGDAGTPGSKMHNVTGTPATSVGVIGDWAINTTNGDIFEKTGTSTWTNRGNIRGPQGLKGDAGQQGTQGAKGDTGQQGPQGLKGDPGTQGPKGDPGDGIKVGATLATATDKKIFFKVIG